jgi:hypothetical protein
MSDELAVGVEDHTATLLESGKVIIVGGSALMGESISTAEIFDYVLGGVYEALFTATGGTAPYSYNIVSGGGEINAATGLYSAKFASSGTAVIKVTDHSGATATTSISLDISD